LKLGPGLNSQLQKGGLEKKGAEGGNEDCYPKKKLNSGTKKGQKRKERSSKSSVNRQSTFEKEEKTNKKDTAARSNPGTTDVDKRKRASS